MFSVRKNHLVIGREDSCRGGAMLEFALLLPILILAGFFAFEAIYAYSHHQVLSALSREIANEAYRSCGESPNINDCLFEKVTSIRNSTENILPEKYTAIVSYYDKSGSPVWVKGGLHDVDSKYNRGTVNSKLGELYRDDGFNYLIISEVFYPNNSFLKKFIYKFDADDNEDYFYEVTIY